MLRLWKGFSGTSLPARQPQPLLTFIAWSVPVINGGLCTQKTVWAGDTQAGLVLLYFWQNGFENCATGTDVANISLYAEGSLFFFFFQEVWLIMHSSSRALKLHGLKKSWCKTRKKQTKQNKTKNQQNVYQKTQTNEQCLFNFTVSVEFSCKYVSNDIFLEKKISLQHCRMWGVTPSQE